MKEIYFVMGNLTEEMKNQKKEVCSAEQIDPEVYMNYPDMIQIDSCIPNEIQWQCFIDFFSFIISSYIFYSVIKYIFSCTLFLKTNSHIITFPHKRYNNFIKWNILCIDHIPNCMWKKYSCVKENMVGNCSFACNNYQLMLAFCIPSDNNCWTIKDTELGELCLVTNCIFWNGIFL